MIPPRPQRRKYFLDPNAHESESCETKLIYDYEENISFNSPPGRITFETAAAAAISRPGMIEVSRALSAWLSH